MPDHKIKMEVLGQIVNPLASVRGAVIFHPLRKNPLRKNIYCQVNPKTAYVPESSYGSPPNHYLTKSPGSNPAVGHFT